MKTIFLKSFTLLEFLIVIGLIFLFTSFILPFGIDFYRKTTIEDLSQELESSLRRAQILALTKRGESDAGIKIKEGEYIIFEGSSWKERRPALDLHRNYPQGIKIKGISEIVFKKEKGIPIFPGLVAHWQLNNIEGTKAYDYSLYGGLNDGEITGTFSWVQGKDKKALEIEGGEIEVPDHQKLNPQNALTLSLWINLTNLTSAILIKKGNPPNGYKLAIDANNNLLLFEIGDGNETHLLSNQIPLDEFLGNWVQISAVWDGNLMEEYLNGEKLPQVKEFSQKIGSSLENLILAENLSGKIDDIRIYDFALSQEDLKANYLSKKDDIVLFLKFGNQRKEISINYQGLITYGK